MDTSELIQLNLEEFKIKHPDVRALEPDMIRYRYNAAERFRIESINLLKKEREKIIEEENNKRLGKEKEINNTNSNDMNRNTYSNMSKTHITTASGNKWGGTNTTTGDDVDMKMEKILSDQKKQ
jgi:aspartyl/asparaginyl-tRNA synthetase